MDATDASAPLIVRAGFIALRLVFTCGRVQDIAGLTLSLDALCENLHFCMTDHGLVRLHLHSVCQDRVCLHLRLFCHTLLRLNAD